MCEMLEANPSLMCIVSGMVGVFVLFLIAIRSTSRSMGDSDEWEGD